MMTPTPKQDPMDSLTEGEQKEIRDYIRAHITNQQFGTPRTEFDLNRLPKWLSELVTVANAAYEYCVVMYADEAINPGLETARKEKFDALSDTVLVWKALRKT